MKKIVLLGMVYSLSGLVLCADVDKVSLGLLASLTDALNAPLRTVKSGLGLSVVTAVVDFNAKIMAGNFTVVKFHAPWCSYCVRMDPIFNAVAAKYADQYAFISINIDNAPELTKQNKIRSIPVFRFFDKTGKQVGEFSSYTDQATFETKMKSFFGAN